MTASTNYADLSNFLVGSDTLKITPFFIKAFTIPGVTLSHPQLPTRSGTKLKLGADNIEFGDLTLEVSLDSNFHTYFELMDLTFQEVDWDYDTFAMPEFDLWVVSRNSKGEEMFRFDFHNCRISNIGEISLDPGAELGTSFAVTITYDYYRWSRKVRREVCGPNGETKVIEETKRVKRYYENAPKGSPAFGELLDS